MEEKRWRGGRGTAFFARPTLNASREPLIIAIFVHVKLLMGAKPFIKWVGGKGQLLSQLDSLLPDDFPTRTGTTYVEPFVGGGAMLFHVLSHYPNIEWAIINDINPDLTACYKAVRNTPRQLIGQLDDIQNEYGKLTTEDDRKAMFLHQRERFNTKTLSELDNATLFIFLNKTCFNGLYRVNKKGIYNVPFGKAVNPAICTPRTIEADSLLLQKVEILTGDFASMLNATPDGSFFYIDPPYRPLNSTSNFNDYAKETFDDAEQIRLKEFCEKLTRRGDDFMLSNSDSKGNGMDDAFFDDLYSPPMFNITRVLASRAVNSDATKRGKISEIVIRNYTTRPTSLFHYDSSAYAPAI